jgi:predicted PurR-regulated permease PerM
MTASKHASSAASASKHAPSASSASKGAAKSDSAAKSAALSDPHRDHVHVGRISTHTTLVVLAAITLLLYEIQLILTPFVLSAIVAYICTPAIEGLSARTGYPRALFAMAFFLLLLAIATVVGYLGVPPLWSELNRVLTDFQGTIRELAARLIGDQKISLFNEPMDAAQLAQMLTAEVRSRLSQPGTLAMIAGGAFGGLFGATLTVILLLYFLLSGPVIARGLLQLVPPQQRPLIMHLWSLLDPVLKRYFVGVLLVVVYASTAAYIGLGVVLGIPHAVVLALLTGFMEMIPVIGPFAAALTAGLVAARYATGIGAIIAYAIYATALRLSIDQLFGPLALGTAARVHPIVVIFGFLVGAYLFGIVGVVLAVPVAIGVKATLRHLYDEPQAIGTAGH